MNDNKTPPPIPKPVARTSAEVAALNSLLQAMNNPNIEGVEIPPGVQTKVTAADVMDAKIANRPPEAEASKAAVAARPAVTKLFFTGRLKSGKDFAAAAAGATIIGFAQPIYAIASHFFDTPVDATQGKDLLGMRQFFQTVGQWGRNVISAQYPLTVERALFVQRVRRKGADGVFGFAEVDWESYGKNPNIWLDACLARANNFVKENPGKRIAVTNCRFDNEFKALQADQYQHWHAICSPAAWTARLAASKLTPESPAVKDLSEQLAIKLDTQVLKAASTDKNGPRLRCIWSDDAPPPSARLHTVASFLQSIG